MSIEAINWALELQGPSLAAKAVLFVLANYANEKGHCYPSIELIARGSGAGEKTVRRAVQTLQSEGIITVIKERRSNHYTLNMGSEYRSESPVNTGQSDQLTGQSDRYNRDPIPVRESLIPVRESTDTGQRVPNTGQSDLLTSTNHQEPSLTSTPIVPTGDDDTNGKESKSDRVETILDAVWPIAPQIARTRSGKDQVRRFIAEKLSRLPEVPELVRRLEAWKRSEAWLKDDGKFIPGLHRWFKRGHWEDVPKETKDHRLSIAEGF